MKKLTTLLALTMLMGCESLGGANECVFDQVSFCLGQAVVEDRMNTLLDSAGSNSCVDIVHSCHAKEQCAFAGCGKDSEAGDWVIEVIEDPRK